MQHYFEDIDDLCDGFAEEMGRRIARITSWDRQISYKRKEMDALEELVLDQSKPMQERLKSGVRLNELRDEIRAITEKKIDIAEKNVNLAKLIGEKLREKAYNCKLELEADNPGCTEAREKLYAEYVRITMEGPETDGARKAKNGVSGNEPGSSNADYKRARSLSNVSEDDRASVRSYTPAPKESQLPKATMKKRPGRPRNIARGGKQAAPSRDHAEAKVQKDQKAPSKYMQKKNYEKLVREEERIRQQLASNTATVEKQLTTGELDPFALNEVDPLDNGELGEEDEQELLQLLNFDGLQSPPQGMMDGLDYGMDMYPSHIRQQSRQMTRLEEAPMSSGDFRRPANPRAATSSASFTDIKRKPDAEAAAATSSSSGDLAEKRKRNLLFGSIPDTSFSGRPRKLTDRVAEMIISNREKEERSKHKKAETDDWCICGGANATNSEMMVACENNNCPIEWFHFACVGLTSSPKDEWFCPECRHRPAQQHNRKRFNGFDHK